jgi:hypothetical protein
MAQEHLKYTASPAKVVRSTLDKLGVPSRPGSNRPIRISDFTIWINQPRQITALTWITTSNLTFKGQFTRMGP